MKFLLGKKLNMTQVFDENGNVSPGTILEAGPTTVTQIKTTGKDGYNAVQIGFAPQKESRLSKALQGHFKKAGTGTFRILREFRTDVEPEYTAGQVFTAGELFKEGDVVSVRGTSKGKGFQGVVKRHGFGGGRRSHGQKHSEREAGSIGGGGRAGGEVRKGKKMAGRMGGDTVTVRNLKVLKVDSENNRLIISGAVPGRRGTVIEIMAKE